MRPFWRNLKCREGGTDKGVDYSQKKEGEELLWREGLSS